MIVLQEAENYKLNSPNQRKQQASSEYHNLDTHLFLLTYTKPHSKPPTMLFLVAFPCLMQAAATTTTNWAHSGGDGNKANPVYTPPTKDQLIALECVFGKH